jgi:hypothetical protein
MHIYSAGPRKKRPDLHPVSSSRVPFSRVGCEIHQITAQLFLCAGKDRGNGTSHFSLNVTFWKYFEIQQRVLVPRWRRASARGDPVDRDQVTGPRM